MPDASARGDAAARPGGGRPVGRKIAFGPMVQRPDPLESTPPAFGEEAAGQILREGFGVESSSIKPLAGERDQNFRVDTAGGQRFLLQISKPGDDRPRPAMQAGRLRPME